MYTSFQQPEVEKRFRNWVGALEQGRREAFTFQMYDPRGNPHAISQASVQFVTIDNEGLKFFWHERTFATVDAPGEKGLIEKEFEKRMKARK